MSRKWVYRIGVIFIFFATLSSPSSYLFLGRIVKGEVTEIVYEHDGISIFPSSAYPRVQFEYENKIYTILGEENQVYLVGDNVKVIFYEWNPKVAKIYSFWGLFIDALIQLPIGLLIWWAFFKSYPNLFISTKEI
jgi:hypothetical protein